MRTWQILFGKEMRESARNYKWVWIPLVFALLGISNPVTSYYMPEILQAGGVSEEAAKLIPVPGAAEIMVKSLSQYGTLGLLVLALAFMGIVASERQSGSAIMVLVKPVSHTSYVLAKWCGMAAITLAAIGLGQLGAWYYTTLLFDAVPFRTVAESFLVYALWLVFVNTLVLLLSCLLRSVGGVAFLSLAIAAVLSLASSLLGDAMRWSPSQLTAQAGHILLDGRAGQDWWPPAAVAAALIIAMLAGSALASKRMWTKA